MRRDSNTRSVTISFSTDQSSLQRALDDIEKLRQSLQTLQGGGQSSSRGNIFQGAPPPPLPPGGAQAVAGPSGNYQSLINSGALSQFGMPFSGGQLGGSSLVGSQSLQLTGVSTVNITASVVNITGGITPSGGAGPTGSGGMATPGGSTHQATAGGLPTSQANQFSSSRYHTPGYNMRSAIDDETYSGQWMKSQFMGQFIPSSMYGASNVFLERFMHPAAPKPFTVPPPSGVGGPGFQIDLPAPAAGSMGAASQALGAVVKILPWALAGMAIHGGGAAATAYHQSQLQNEMAAAGFGMGSINGQWATAGQRAMLGIRQAEEPSRRAWTTFTQSTGLYQVGNFLSGGTLDRLQDDIDQYQTLRGQRADLQDKFRMWGALGIGGAGRLGKSLDFNDSRMSTGESAEELAARIGNLDTLGNRLRGSFANSGFFAAADNSQWAEKFVRANSNRSVELEQLLVGGIVRAAGSNRYLGLDMSLGQGGNMKDVTATNAYAMLMGQADASQIAQLRANLTQGGLSVDDANRNLYAFGKQSLDRGYEIQMAGSRASTSISRGQYLGARGGSATQIAGYTAGAAGSLYAQVAGLEEQYQMIKSTAPDNPQTRAELAAMRAQIESTRASAASLEKESVLSPYQSEQTISQIDQARYGVSTTRTAYRGIDPRYNAGYALQISEARKQEMSIRRQMGDIDAWSKMRPEEQAQLRYQLEQAQLAQTEIARSQTYEGYQVDTATISYSQAGRTSALAQSQLFGTPGEIAGARREQLKTIDESIAAEKELLKALGDDKSKIQERLGIETRIIDLQREKLTTEEQIKRDQVAQTVGIFRTQASTIGTYGQMSLTLSGSEVSTAQRRASISTLQQTLPALRAELARTVPGTARYAELEGEIANTESSVQSQQLALGQYSPSQSIRQRSIMADTQYNIMTRTFAQFGDVRGAINSKMGLVDEQIAGVRSQYKASLADSSLSPEKRDYLKTQYMQQEAELINQKIGLQQQLESGFTERLIAEVHNAPSRFSGVMAGFTRREASSFMTVQPFGGNKEQADYFKNKGRLWYNNVAHAMGTPEGFNSMALSGLSPTTARGGGAGVRFGPIDADLGGGPALGAGSEIELRGTIQLEINVAGGDASSGMTGQSMVKNINLNNQTLVATLKPNKGAMP